MSLINQMLQDLEKRRASGAERGALPDQVRVLPREESRSMPRWLIGIAAAAALIALLAWQFNHHAPPTVPAPVALEQQSPGAVLESGMPASRLALDLEKAPLPKTRASARSGTVALNAPVQDKSAPVPLATGTLVAAEPAVKKAVHAEAKADAAKPASPTEAPRMAPVTPAAQVAAVSAPGKPVVSAPRAIEVLPETKAPAEPQIDKRFQTLTPQQLAENEYRDAANLLNQGRLAEAQDGFRRALQQNPAHVGARQALFSLLVDAKKSGEAEQLLQEGLALNPGQPGFATALATLQYGRGDIAAAVETMQKAAPAAQSSPDYLARLAGLLQRQSRHKEAVENYQAALRLAPGSGVWLMGLGISLQALNRNGEAQEAFRRARATNTLNPDLQAFVEQRLRQLQ